MTDTLHIPVEVRWGDLDAFNHVNNVALMRLLEEARVRAFWAPAPGETAPPTGVMQSGAAHGVLAVIARHEVEYRAPIPYTRHPLDVEMWFSHLGGASLEICYRVRGGGPDKTLYAEAASTMVLIDAETNRPARLTQTLRDAWTPYLSDRITFSSRS